MLWSCLTRRRCTVLPIRTVTAAPLFPFPFAVDAAAPLHCPPALSLPALAEALVAQAAPPPPPPLARAEAPAAAAPRLAGHVDLAALVLHRGQQLRSSPSPPLTKAVLST